MVVRGKLRVESTELVGRAIPMEPSSVETDRIVQEFDGDACKFCERYKNKGLSRSSKLLLRFILDNAVRDRSVLDLGCGAGGLSLELLKEGAGKAVGFDLSPKMISVANELAQANGFESRAKFQLGNGATSELPRIGYRGYGQDAMLLFR